MDPIIKILKDARKILKINHNKDKIEEVKQILKKIEKQWDQRPKHLPLKYECELAVQIYLLKNDIKKHEVLFTETERILRNKKKEDMYDAYLQSKKDFRVAEMYLSKIQVSYLKEKIPSNMSEYNILNAQEYYIKTKKVLDESKKQLLDFPEV